MSTRPARRRARTSDPIPATPDLLCYADQLSFLVLRAAGRGPTPRIGWTYDEPIPIAEVERFRDRLAAGFLGRRVQRSPLPWGRHRWVAAPAAPIHVAPEPIPPSEVMRWSASLNDLPLDPEHGPGWHLAAQPLTDGGLAVALTVSHTLADGVGLARAIVDAAHGTPFAHVYPPPSSRRSRILPDLRETVRALPAAGRALAALARQPRLLLPSGPRPPARPPGPGTAGGTAPVALPLAHVALDAEACAAAEKRLGVTANTLIVAFTVRLAARIGRVGPDGEVALTFPVSERVPGDPRGNALTAMELVVDPEACLADPRPLQRALKAAMVTLLRDGYPATALLPLIPYVPLRLARGLDGLIAGAPWNVGCSLYGDVDPALVRPFGVEASAFWVTPMVEAHTEASLAQRGGLLFVGGGRGRGRVEMFVGAWQPGRVTTDAELASAIRATLADLALPGTLA